MPTAIATAHPIATEISVWAISGAKIPSLASSAKPLPMADGAGRYSYSSSPDRTATSHVSPARIKTAVPGQLIPAMKRLLSMSAPNGPVHGVAKLKELWKLARR